MSVIDKLASSLNDRNEVPNQELANNYSKQKSEEELIENPNNKSKDIQNDCIKVYEVSEISAALIADYANNFIALLDHKNNRLQWGAMTVIMFC